MRVCTRCAARFDGDAWRCVRCGFDPPADDRIVVLAPDLAHANAADASYRHADLSAAQTHHFWFDARNRLIIAVLQRHFPAARSFLDLGCGTGGASAAIDRRYPDLELVAGDALLAALRIASTHVPRASAVQLDVSHLPYEREFDVIGAFDVLEHLDDDEAVLREMRRATKPGGGVIITVPQHPFLWSAVDEFSCHRRRYTRTELLDKVRRAGFGVERVTSFMALVLPAMLLSRIGKRDVATLDPVAELRIAAAPNAVLRAICRLEAATIAAGWSWPAGGSLLVVARAPSE
jgi:SAM-dependent methyltransferase